MSAMTARDLVRRVLELDVPPKPTRDVDNPCDAYEPGEPEPSGHCMTDGHYMCRECTKADPEAIAERDA